MSLCKTLEKFTFFPDGYGQRDGTRLCKRFGGKRVDVSSRRNINEILDWLVSMKEDPEFYENMKMDIHTMFNDEEHPNVWKNYETNNLPQDPFDWNFGEPNGGAMENCAQLLVKRNPEISNPIKWIGKFNDIPCSQLLPVACEHVVKVFTLRDNTMGVVYRVQYKFVDKNG